MKTNLYLNGKKTTDAFMYDPYEQNSYFIGCGMLNK